MKKGKPKAKPRRVVLGVGYPWFSSNREMSHWVSVGLRRSPSFDEIPLVTIPGLRSTQRIRLVAEVIE